MGKINTNCLLNSTFEWLSHLIRIFWAQVYTENNWHFNKWVRISDWAHNQLTTSLLSPQYRLRVRPLRYEWVYRTLKTLTPMASMQSNIDWRLKVVSLQHSWGQLIFVSNDYSLTVCLNHVAKQIWASQLNTQLINSFKDWFFFSTIKTTIENHLQILEVCLWRHLLLNSSLTGCLPKFVSFVSDVNLWLQYCLRPQRDSYLPTNVNSIQ